ncbi:hypothetical protein J7E62_24705 [Variovorax paradoxus]|nr:hypothetical protein [Variovorax paradoxus]
MNEIRPINGEDVCLWPDGSWCYRCDLEEYSWMSDDYEVIRRDSQRAEEIVNG